MALILRPAYALVRAASSMAWELRGAWASGRRVAVTIDCADSRRVEGHVGHVSATGASVTIAGLLIPLDRVLAVHLPSRLGDSAIVKGQAWRGRGHLHRLARPGQLAFRL